jgi:hypothetical protein
VQFSSFKKLIARARFPTDGQAIDIFTTFRQGTREEIRLDSILYPRFLVSPLATLPKNIFFFTPSIDECRVSTRHVGHEPIKIHTKVQIIPDVTITIPLQHTS